MPAGLVVAALAASPGGERRGYTGSVSTCETIGIGNAADITFPHFETVIAALHVTDDAAT